MGKKNTVDAILLYCDSLKNKSDVLGYLEITYPVN